MTLARGSGRGRAIRGAGLLGLAIAAKVTPVLTVPAVMRRRPVTLAAGGAAAAGIVYMPHVLAVGAGVIGFLPGYLNQEAYSNDIRFQLLSMVMPGGRAALAAVAVLPGVARPSGARLTQTGRGAAPS